MVIQERMNKKFISLIIAIVIWTGSYSNLTAQDKKSETLSLSLDEAVMLVISNNLVIQDAKYDIIMSDGDFEKFQQKFTPYLNAEASYLNSANPVSGNAQLFGGQELQQFDATVSLSKLFSTGTMITMGLKENYFDSNDKALNLGMLGSKPADPGYYKPSIFLSIQQELLKNGFGYGDRKTLDILEKSVEIKRSMIADQLSLLIVQTLSEYWGLNILSKAVENAQTSLDATNKVRDIINKNVKFGLADTFELNQYNSLVAIAETTLAMAKQNYDDAYKKLLRTLNLDPETKIKNVTELNEDLPEIDLEKAIESAFKKRSDYINAQKELELHMQEKLLYTNSLLPSLMFQAGLSTKEQSDTLGTAHKDLFSMKYPDWQIGLKASYPLWNFDSRVKVRDAELSMRKSRNKIERLDKEIRDEVISRSEHVKLSFYILTKQREIRKESQLYYNAVLEKNKNAKFDSAMVKNALDSVINARQRELEMIIKYNIALLQFDLAKNEIFDRYGINVNKIISEVK